MAAHDRRHDLWDKIWKDSDGRVIMYQRPNVPLIAWAVLTVISLLLNGKTASVLSVVATSMLGIWALLEIFRGVNYFRRALGLLVMIFVIMSLIRSL